MDSPKTIEMMITLNNFHGLQYECDTDTAEFEVTAACLQNILKSDQRITGSAACSVLCFQFALNEPKNEDLFDLFMNPLLLTLIKYENEILSIIGYCSIDLSPLFSTQIETIECHKHFESEAFGRKISFDVKISTNNPLLDFDYENSLMFTLHSINNIQNVDKMKIGMKVPYQIEFYKDVTFEINPTQSIPCYSKFKHWFSLYNTPGNASCSSYSDDFDLESQDLLLPETSQIKINAVFKSLILTQDASYTFYDHIRKSKKFVLEIILNDTEHLFGLLDCEELLHVGTKRVKSVVPLYKFEKEIFKQHAEYESLFYKPVPEIGKRNSRKTSKVTAEAPSSLDEIKALDENGCQIFIVIGMELEKSLNQEIFEDDLLNQQDIVESPINNDGLVDDLKKELLGYTRNLLQKYDGFDLKETIQEAILNGDLIAIENLISPKIEVLKNQMLHVEDEIFKCHLTSKIVNPEKNEDQSLFLAKVYEALGEADKAQDEYLVQIMNDRKSECLWNSFAIFNARRENFDLMAVCIDEALKIEPESLIGNILKAYMLFKTRKFKDFWTYLNNLKQLYGNIEELYVMEVVVNQMLGNEQKFIEHSFNTHKAIDAIYCSKELSWYAERDDCFLSWQNSFIKCSIFFIKIGCFDIAELCLGEYHQKYGININYLYLLGAIDSLKGNYKDALLHLNKIPENDIVNHQLNHSKIVTSIVMNLLHLKNFEKAKKLFNTYMHVQSCDNFPILFLLGSHFNDTNEFGNAKNFLIRAAQILKCHIVFKELGKCFKNLESFDLAEKSLITAVHIEMSDMESWMNLREIYEIQNRTDATKLCDLNNLM